MEEWSIWRAFPDPRKCEFITAPLGPGVYDLRNKATGQKVLFGIGKHLAHRMTSLLPKPFGRGTRNNSDKRQYVFDNLPDIEYRCLACETREEAKTVEDALPKSEYVFSEKRGRCWTGSGQPNSVQSPSQIG